MNEQNEYEQNEPTGSEIPQYPSTHAPISDDAIKWQLEPLPVLNEIEYYLKGYVYNQITGLWEEKGLRLMNDEGVSTLITYLRSILNKNNVQGNLDQKQMNMLMSAISRTMILFLPQNYKRFDIKKVNFDLIQNAVETQCYMFLSRTIGDGERKRHSINYHYGEQKIKQESADKKGWGLLGR
jgi:hypothetical protein